MNNEEQLTKDFVNACQREMMGKPMTGSLVDGHQLAGELYRPMATPDPKQQAFLNSMAVERMAEVMITFFNSNAPVSDKKALLKNGLASMAVFGLFVQRKVNQRSGMIV